MCPFKHEDIEHVKTDKNEIKTPFEKTSNEIPISIRMGGGQ